MKGTLIARSKSTVRVCETASPPTFYIPFDHVDFDLLKAVQGHTYCEWKGQASYWSLAGQTSGTQVAWHYHRPLRHFQEIKNHLSFYPGRVDCVVDGFEVRPQQSEFYGGWVTPEVVGPFKGDPGTGGW